MAALSKQGDPLEAIAALVPWESFRADIEAVVLTLDESKKSKAGRKPFDAILMFRMLILQSLYNLSDEQIEYQVRDRLSFTRFLGLEFEDDIPDGTTLWLFREKLAKAALIETLFERFDRHLECERVHRARRPNGGRHASCRFRSSATRREENEIGEARRDAGGVGGETGQEPAER